MSRNRAARLAIPAAIIFAAFAVPTLSGSAGPPSFVPPPSSVLGWQPCTDYKLSNYEQIAGYFQAIDRASNRMKIVHLGRTSEGRDQIMAIVSSPKNLEPKNLDKYARISRELSQVSVPESRAKDLASRGKTIAWINFGIHSTEVAPTQTAPQFAYDLVTSESAEAKSIRDNVITLFVPNINPTARRTCPTGTCSTSAGPTRTRPTRSCTRSTPATTTTATGSCST